MMKRLMQVICETAKLDESLTREQRRKVVWSAEEDEVVVETNINLDCLLDCRDLRDLTNPQMEAEATVGTFLLFLRSARVLHLSVYVQMGPTH